MANAYQVELSVLLKSLEYCSDVESDGFYVIKGTNEIIEYGEDLSEDYALDSDIPAVLKSDDCLQLPTLHDLENASPNWNRDITLAYIETMIADEKQRRHLTNAYNSVFRNRILHGFPGSTKLSRELGRLGRMEQWNQYVQDAYKARQMEFITAWCKAHGVEIVFDTK